MFTDLSFIDWVALVFAAVLLAAAAAAALVAYITTKNRMPKPTSAAIPARKTPAHAAMPMESGAHVVEGAPSPPIMVSSPKMTDAVMSDGVRIEPSSQSPEDTVAARAAKLRGRPVPEKAPANRKRIVSVVEPGRMPAHAPNRAFVGAYENAGRVSIDMDSTAGFAARTPGFYEDPVGRHELRYWDGHRWTEYVKEHGERFTDPL
jgi:hypothetical protein